MGKIISLEEVGQKLGVTSETARRWCVEGRIPAFRYDTRGRWRVDADKLDDWIRSRQNETESGQETSVSQ